MQFNTTLESFSKTESKVYKLHFPIPEEVALKIMNKDQRFICKINGTMEIPCGLMPSKNYWFILMNKTLSRQLNLLPGDRVDIELIEDNSEYGIPMPAELQECLDQDLTANNYFHQLTPGKQRNLIYLVSKVKNTDSKINKSLAIVDHLKEAGGKLDFKALNSKIKAYNQRHKHNL